MKIVVHGTNWIGDAVMTIPALRKLRSIFPDAHITLHSRPWAKGIFRDCDFVDELSIPERGGLISESALWRRRRFDLAVLFTSSFRTALIAKLAGVPKRIGYATEGRRFLLNEACRMPAWKNTRHEVYFYLNLVSETEKRIIGRETPDTENIETELAVGPERRRAARELLGRSGADLSMPLIGFGVGSQNSKAKRWPPGNFAQLGDFLKKKYQGSIVLLGSENEQVAAAEVSAGSEEPPINLTGGTTLDDAVAVLAELDLFVSNDMGLAHVAAAVGTATMTIFGPTNPLTTRPWNGEIVRREDVECSPCMLRACPIDHRCMTRIKAEDVFSEISAILASK
ncbi:MAG: lipopolysaccharide heptosyltransferase II [Acidobacteriota bacterium]|nr:lipopolysaccharide heptosyltransferase II [Acidobacteriota bacterium]